ncbi:RCC1 domain-containing protein [Deinococcus altitudinis]|uniref:RCC1 domain-containing protein n=1 Tax=Deinococcus altitudinis TaxID=468914 RepID=UPI0038911F1F
MTMPRFLLFTGLLALTACSSTVPSTAVPVVTTPTQTSSKLGVVEIEFSGIGSQLQAAALRPLTTQALTDRPCVAIGSSLAQSTVDLGGKRYMQATFPVTNNCTTDLKNLTYVAVRRLGSNATLGDSAITSMKTFGGTDAAVSLATQILPTQPVYISGKRLNVDQNTANLQVFDDTNSGELDGLQSQVDANRTTYDLLPYGFVVSSVGSRTIPIGGTGEVTFALSVPIQTSKAQDIFSFRLLANATTNSVTSVTQGLEEQDAAGKAAVETRAAALPGSEIRTLLGPALTSATFATGSVPVCQVRTAGPRSAPTATLVNTQGTLSLSAPYLPSIIGGAQLQPGGTVTVNGNQFPAKVSSLTSLTPATLSVTNNLVHPVVAFPLQRQTGTVQAGSSCSQQTINVPMRISPFTSLEAGGQHTLGVKSNGTVVAWGDSSSGQTTVPPELRGVVSVSAGAFHSVALKSDGTVVAWGDNGVGQVNVPAGLGGVVAVSAGQSHNLALKSNGTVVAWGYNGSGQTAVPAGLSGVVAVSAGAYHSVALKSDGTVVAWGSNSFGQTSVPVWLSGVVAISAGQSHNLALKSDGTVVAWGFNGNGQLNVPEGLSGVVAVSAGEVYNVALKSDGMVVGWGSNGYGQADIPVSVSTGGVVAVSIGQYHGLALKSDGTVVAWGSNSTGQATVPDSLTLTVP